jgi:hypothetical protein
MSNVTIEAMAQLIQQMRHDAEALLEKSHGIQAVERNLNRLLASIRMLELNVSDIKELV